MKRYLMFAAVPLLLVVVVAVANGIRHFRASLAGDQEVPVVSTVASGDFKARINNDETQITYELSYSDLEGDVQQAHIHVGQKGVNGGISVFLCSNLGNGPAGTQPCPPSPAKIEGTLSAVNVIGPIPQGIAAGEFAELIEAIRAGNTYANVHSSKFPGGEVRSQIGKRRSEHDH
ncbi:MAG: CHRD domain-containing protein [Saprospiraceae bacterium]|nr:CHRD domain-containing protein [Pyrinomonadaceae bacterium]